MNTVLVLATIAVILVVILDYTNGFHDASNIIATPPPAAPGDAPPSPKDQRIPRWWPGCGLRYAARHLAFVARGYV